MARVLAYTSPARGHLYPLTPILAELRRRGHQVALRTMASQVPLMRELGFDAAAIDEQIEKIRHDDWQTSSQPAALGRSVATFLARARCDGPDLRTAIAETDPDVVIVDINSWGAVAAAEAWGGRWASFCPYPLPVSSREAPPFGPGFAPARGPLGRLRDRIARPIVLGTVERTMMPKVNAVRTEHGLGSLKNGPRTGRADADRCAARRVQWRAEHQRRVAEGCRAAPRRMGVALLDSNMVIGFLDADDLLHQAADAAVRAAATKHVFAVSVVTVADLLTGAKLGHHDERTVRRFFAQTVSRRIALDEPAAERAAELRAAHKALKMPDALILATADLNADVVLTGDDRWLKISGLTCELRYIASGAPPT